MVQGSSPEPQTRMWVGGTVAGLGGVWWGVGRAERWVGRGEGVGRELYWWVG